MAIKKDIVYPAIGLLSGTTFWMLQLVIGYGFKNIQAPPCHYFKFEKGIREIVFLKV